MKLAELENELLKLEAHERGRLAAKLIASLDDLTDSETQELWLEEARRRDAELDGDVSKGKPAEDVFQNARTRLR